MQLRKTILVRAFATTENQQKLEHKWTVTAGKIKGQGEKVQWDFTSVIPWTYETMMQVKDSVGR